ncbi:MULTISPECIES: tripartite tricarboxylate transporter TctB family protein [unclassified Halomonas]|uniref:tripartite tricarboxylate transporter TctB family protein n=1 Tax=unclassified Halomonas TaxID=2609666 RepID=UPI0006D96E5B|nr:MULTISPECIES: tripartite tricarboxylate transporter TctB family protein [unclassified Halomonas]KPQ20504.1 MAG: Tripartite tricarboxylate transporter TctB family [Halomonas sp. HL-93]SBR46592.1 Tripartite tricarboxylate transporter TctB family protein [Halomonas sp. HL-93]SNY98821.1 Tripartite tricarboxylate transporter TctB family protein [Halomonas sp. hl-4]
MSRPDNANSEDVRDTDYRDADSKDQGSLSGANLNEYSGEKSVRGLHHDLIVGLVVIVGASYLLTFALDMPPMSSVLPIAMLGALIVLSLLMVLRTLINIRNGRSMAHRYQVFVNKRRFFGITFAILAYSLGVSLIGFYTTTAMMIPAVAWCFGYRHIKRLLLADLIFTGGLAIIFVLLMGQDLPPEFFIR